MAEQRIKIEARFSIHPGKSAAVQPIQEQLNQLLGTTEATTFNTQISADQSTFQLQALAPSYEAFQKALVIIGPTLDALNQPAPVDKVRVFGAVTDEMKASMAGFPTEFLSFAEAGVS
ncbi:MAG: hypothetical protein AAGD01_15720 [Acidobacteriota bacterium]